jgi:chromosome segregation ATPase
MMTEVLQMPLDASGAIKIAVSGPRSSETPSINFARQRAHAAREVRQARTVKQQANQDTRQARQVEQEASKRLQSARVDEQRAARRVQEAQAEQQQISQAVSRLRTRGGHVNIVV